MSSSSFACLHETTRGCTDVPAPFAIRESRIANGEMALKPQDVHVVLKLAGTGARRAPYSHLAVELVMSSSEVHASCLLHGQAWDDRANIGALEEFLVHGLKYVFPVEPGEMKRGVATSYGAAPLRDMIAPTDEPIPVWPYAEGKQRGISMVPLYKTAPVAALRDGRVRERKIAQASCTEGCARPLSNTEQLIATAELLRPLLGELVIVGGAVTSLLVTDTGAGVPRPTLDVDAIAEITSYPEYAAFDERLRAVGFSEDMSEGAPLAATARR
jgi:hypothetical protein